MTNIIPFHTGRQSLAKPGKRTLELLAGQMAAQRNRQRQEAEQRRRQGSRPEPVEAEGFGPTAEQRARGVYDLEDTYESATGGKVRKIGKAYRRRPMIDTLADQGLFSDAEHKALRHYRHHADMVDKSPLKDSLNKQIGGGRGDGRSHQILVASRIVTDCERAVGSLVDILRAVVVDDVSLSQWAISKAGGIDDCTVKNGERVCRLKPRQKALEIAKLEIQMAAKRVRAELDA